MLTMNLELTLRAAQDDVAQARRDARGTEAYWELSYVDSELAAIVGRLDRISRLVHVKASV